MINLTEHGKPQLYGYYYVEFKNGKQGIKQFGEFANTWTPKKTLCEVPSCELWKAVHEQRNVLLEENAQLKELLKEVLRHDLSLKEVSELTRKISQVLGEE